MIFIFRFVVLLLHFTGTWSFIFSNTCTTRSNIFDDKFASSLSSLKPTIGDRSISKTLLHAKKAKAKKKKSSNATSSKGVGFGVASKESNLEQIDDDYAAFPRLEKSVEDTLIPSDDTYFQDLDDESLLLPAEIRGRLDQVYGFPHFNYITREDVASEDHKGETSSVSFGDLLASTDGDQETKSTSDFDDILKASSTSSSSGSDFADLIASATGGTASSSSSISSIKESPSSSLPSDSASLNSIVSNDIPLSNIPPFKEVKVLHVDPLVIEIDNFFTSDECNKYIAMSEAPKTKQNIADSPLQSRSKTVGKDKQAKSQRTSTTWFHHFKGVPELMAKSTRLLGLSGSDINRWEEPQTVRYRRKEKFTWHLDALSPAESPQDKGGQRIATLLVYLTDLQDEDGGATLFRDLGGDEKYLRVRPKKGSALLFFPAAGGIPNRPFDIRTLHCGEAVSAETSNDKWIAQLWLRESAYTPTAPPGNTHAKAEALITQYCEQ